jgi:hypothetical protein
MSGAAGNSAKLRSSVAEHVAEDERSIRAVRAVYSVYGRAWQTATPSLLARIDRHVALDDCPLGRLQAGGRR